ncbi:MAG TPA: hypothetical protein VF479_09890 [Pseudolysinimonas sp.]
MSVIDVVVVLLGVAVVGFSIALIVRARRVTQYFNDLEVQTPHWRGHRLRTYYVWGTRLGASVGVLVGSVWILIGLLGHDGTWKPW